MQKFRTIIPNIVLPFAITLLTISLMPRDDNAQGASNTTAAVTFTSVDAQGAQTADSAASFFQAGEKLEYKVTFLSFTLGTLILTADSIVNEDGSNVLMTHIRLDSRPGIPFLNAHAVDETQFDEGGFTRLCVESEEESDGQWGYCKFQPDYSNQKLIVEKGIGSRIINQKEISTPFKYNDGLSTICFIRKNLAGKKYCLIHALGSSDTGRTIINFTNERDTKSINALDYPVDCLHFKGRIYMKGIYGFTGDFEGWFSNDDARVPIKVQLNLYLGSATLELVKWQRAGWTPPHG